MPKLIINKINYEINNHKILENISFEVNKGEIITIYGKSGCGKSTLLKAISDLIPSTGGMINIHGKNPEIARKDKFIECLFYDL